MIEKIAPKKYVADKDERLVGDGEMILAENVTISERGEGTFGVLKTMKGTTEVALLLMEKPSHRTGKS